jgi:hypothetical protein
VNLGTRLRRLEQTNAADEMPGRCEIHSTDAFEGGLTCGCGKCSPCDHPDHGAHCGVHVVHALREPVRFMRVYVGLPCSLS